MFSLAMTQRARGAASAWMPGEIEAVISYAIAGLAVAFLLYRFVRRFAWPRPFRLWFALVNVAAALACGVLWLVLSIAVESLFTGSLLETRAITEAAHSFPLLGVFLYVVVAGITYSVESTARAARAEALAARTQLAALRAQLHPHFLFNALHTVVQLIPTDPARAGGAAELVASLLRTTIEEDRDEVPLDDEWTFVSRYLEVEHIRFGDRLRVRADVDPNLRDERVPSFALQTLVENAVRHGAAHRVAPTEIVVTATGTDSHLTISVWNTDERGSAENVSGTGLSRLRERLRFLYGEAASLTCGPRGNGGFEAVLVVPRNRSEA
ncbi:MAG TPA: histidine kinase [Thermoanaerobaculia bacterium]|jgi:LytS/YehU family sensor histidine kinase